MEGSAARRRDRFRVLYGENAPALLGYALRRVRTAADAADVVAETFLVAWRRLDDVPPGRQARPWLFGVSRRVMANQRRGALRRSALADKLRRDLVQQVRLDEPVGREDPAPPMAALQAALERLPEDDRELLRLTTWEGLSPTELATVLGIPAATVRTRLHRARRRLRQAFEAEDLERSWPSGHVTAGGHLLAPDGREEP